MTTITEIEDDLNRWCLRVLPDRELHYENTDVAKPNIPYVAIFLREVEDFPHDVVSYADDVVTETIRGLTRVRITVTCWDGNARQDANRLRASARSDNAILDLYANMGRSRIENIIDLTGVDNGRRQPRAEFSINAYTNLTETFGADCFDSVEIRGID